MIKKMFGKSIISVLSNVLHIKHFKISEIFWIFNIEVLDILKLNIIQRHNFFQSFASIGRVDLVCEDLRCVVLGCGVVWPMHILC